MSVVERPREGEFPPFAKEYVSCVYSDDVVQVLADQILRTVALVRSLGEERSLFAYAPGKWTVKQTVGHISDAERVFAYRVLRIARGDTTPLPGFEQDDYVPNAGSNERSIEELVRELLAVRESTLALVRALPPAAWDRTGTASGFACTVRGLVFTLAGHELHHFKILEERYVKGLFPSPAGRQAGRGRVPPKSEGILESSLYVSDVARSARFYERLFGFRVISSFGDRGCAMGAGDRQVLLLFQKGGSRTISSPHDGDGELHLAFAIDRTDLAGWEDWLAENGIPVEEIQTWKMGGQSVYFRDPDRHLIEIATPGVWSIY